MTLATLNPELDTQQLSHPEPVMQAITLSAGYARKPVINDVSCNIYKGELLGIIGPNGCGKSTLLKTLAGNLSPMTGSITLNEQSLHHWTHAQRARLLAMLPQHPQTPPGMTVSDLIRCGRSPHAKWFQAFNTTDEQAINYAIESCELQDLTHRPLAELSGGQRQRAWIAMTIAQQTNVLLLDEPTSALDIGHQLDVLRLLESLTKDRNLAIVIVMHDINLAIRFCDRVLVMQDGHLVGQCCNRRCSDWSLLERVFGIDINDRTHNQQPMLYIDRSAEHCLCKHLTCTKASC